MDTYKGRLASFSHPNWPARHPIRPEAFAAAYQYYTGHADKTKCYYCNGRFMDWKPGEDPVTEHNTHFPDCKISKNTKKPKEQTHVDNGKDEKEKSTRTETASDSAKTCFMAEFENRLKTFSSTKWPKKHKNKIEALAKAGQYYTGFKDETRCFVCNKTTMEWQIEDDPAEEHKRLYPDCTVQKVLNAAHGNHGKRKDSPTEEETTQSSKRSKTTTTSTKTNMKKAGSTEGDYQEAKESKQQKQKMQAQNPLCTGCKVRPRSELFKCKHFIYCANCAAECENICPICTGVNKQ